MKQNNFFFKWFEDEKAENPEDDDDDDSVKFEDSDGNCWYFVSFEFQEF